MTTVKICGLMVKEDTKMVDAYADATGVVVDSKSHRCVSLDVAKEIISHANIPVFAVSTTPSVGGWIDIIKKTGARYVQMHSQTISSYDIERIRSSYDVFVMKAFKVPMASKDPSEDAEFLLNEIKQYGANMALLDTGQGSGIVHDHNVSKIVAEKTDIILAGGLTPQNVGQIIQFVRPCGVDVSSGVEVNGIKDAGRIKEFVKQVR